MIVETGDPFAPARALLRRAMRYAKTCFRRKQLLSEH
jgi:hypothetical protein